MEVSASKIDMVNNLLDGANIQNCGDTNEIAVSIIMESISLDKKFKFLFLFSLKNHRTQLFDKHVNLDTQAPIVML